MPQLPSGLCLALSRDWLFDHGGNWTECPEGHFWYWTAAPEMGPGPFDPNDTILRSAEHAPVPTSREEAKRFILVLEKLADDNFGWRGVWLDSFPRFTALTGEDRAAWDAWMRTPATERFLDGTIEECERLAEVSRKAQGYIKLTSAPPLASQHLRLAADQGDAEAQFRLGYNYGKGLGVPQDYAEAARWFRLSADQGYAAAQSALGYCYANGLGILQDHAEARKWYHLAADNGDPEAQTTLGDIYALGLGVPKDFVSAYLWFSLAAAQGHQRAVRNRYELSGVMTPTQIAEARRLVRERRPTEQ